jgi:hypothetical protein
MRQGNILLSHSATIHTVRCSSLPAASSVSHLLGRNRVPSPEESRLIADILTETRARSDRLEEHLSILESVLSELTWEQKMHQRVIATQKALLLPPHARFEILSSPDPYYPQHSRSIRTGTPRLKLSRFSFSCTPRNGEQVAVSVFHAPRKCYIQEPLLIIKAASSRSQPCIWRVWAATSL